MNRIRTRALTIARNPWTGLAVATAITVATACLCLPGITANYTGGPLTPP